MYRISFNVNVKKAREKERERDRGRGRVLTYKGPQQLADSGPCESGEEEGVPVPPLLGGWGAPIDLDQEGQHEEGLEPSSHL